MGRLFGTDGVRGIANKDLTNELAMKIGSAAATVLLEESKAQNQPFLSARTRVHRAICLKRLSQPVFAVSDAMFFPSALFRLLPLPIWLGSISVRRAL